MRRKDEQTTDAAATPDAIATPAGSDADAAGAGAASDAAATQSDAASTDAKPGAGAKTFRVERVAGERRITALPVPKTATNLTVRFDESGASFDVDRETALAAVATGAFRVADDSPMKLKEKE